MDYLIHILIMICIYIILAESLNLIAGYTGMVSIAHASFYGVGAYITALMAIHLNSPFIVNLTCAVIFSGLLGGLVGIPAIRVRNDYLVIATFAFQVIAFSVLNNWTSLTGGPMGLTRIPHPTIFGLKVASHSSFLMLVGFVSAFILWVSYRVVHSPFGRVLKAIREDEIFAQAAGKNVNAYKVTIFMIGAGMASIAGVLYAHYMGFIDPTSFTVMESIFIISIVIIGGAGSLSGSIIGAIVLVTIPELLRLIGLPTTLAANLRQILYGGLLVAFMMWRPQGFVGDFSFHSESKNDL